MPARPLPLALVLLLALVPAAAAGEPPPVPAPTELPRAQAAFGFDVYARIRTAPGNLFFSPYSLATALSMAREGAAGETARQMDAVLHLPGGGTGAQAAHLAAALRAPKASAYRDGAWVEEPAFELSTANALWIQEGFAAKPGFQTTLRDDYGAPPRRVDFAQTEAARKLVNAWVEEETRGRIQDILPEGTVSPLTRMILANAIYMKAPWADPFPERATKEQPFYGPGGVESRAPLMHRVGSYPYAEGDGFQVLELPYRSGDLSMVVMLPRARDGLAALEEGLDAASFQKALEGLATRRVDVSFPRFEITMPLDCTPVLQALGMKDAFSVPDADFSGITDAERLFLGFVIHKAFVKVDEQGTEAAAATAVGLRAAARPPRPAVPVVFRADHPFFFAIRHRPTGALLFVGRLVDPAS